MVIKEETMNSEIIYNGKIVNLRIDTVELPQQKYSKREIVEHPGGVAVIAITDDGEVIMVRQYRKAVEDAVLEIPAGKLDPGEDPRECAARELKEETGYEADTLEHLVDFYSSPGFTNEKIHIYLARGLRDGLAQPDENEYIDIELYSMQSLLDMASKNMIKDAKSLVALLYASNFKG
ncbi:ADP-ribose pyrophosphatase NudF [Peptoclostridium acidaminophilum DSM 3953]|uniref:ADP-ribose pyrophosphatase NudF n=1 Tax=Peptoclostridium acidaminophilum DSM 3953 TaxID=1286171 RepID=W8T6K9_PEPAC|nr:NUDIX hydrolase [Peptoclostridium acidaminophilum]AHM56515.1 ADP-ribose pyrophosphatase NudF [Peptoclostridium acidaminophilum DSM 3953]